MTEHEIETGFFPERFTVSAEGMSDLNKERFEGLIYELIQNVFDEDSATEVLVSIYANWNSGVRVVVKDNGDGFANARDAWRILGPNAKRRNPEKRGRFNWGQQQALSVATEATVTTVGYTVGFPKTGGRVVRRNRRKQGTEIRMIMPWTICDAEQLRERVRLVRPPEGYRLKLNGREVSHEQPLKVHEAVLESVIQDNPGEPMRRTRRKTRIEISEPARKDGKGQIYEMGMPVQVIDTPYDVNILQKVPMPPNRDTVGEAYLQDIYSELLNAMHNDMKREEFSETWVRTAVEDSRVTDGAARTTLQKRYGRNAVLWSSNKGANLEAADTGAEVIHWRAMSKAERESLQEKGGLELASVRYGQTLGHADSPHFREVDISDDLDKQDFAEWVMDIGRSIGLVVDVLFIHNSRSFAAADCTRGTTHPTMRFNTARLNDEFFTARDREQLGLVIHELGHAYSGGELSHGYSWGNACADVGALVALEFAERTRTGKPLAGAPRIPKPLIGRPQGDN